MLAEGMNNLLSGEGLAVLVIFIAVAGCVVIAMCGIIAHFWQRARQAEIEAALKQDMLNRGMSADEIAKVITASPADRQQAPSKAVPKKSGKDPA